MMNKYLVAALLTLGACKHATLAGSIVEDNKENREIYALLQAFQTHFEARDLKGILALVSQRYYEDMGTADLSDDYGYPQLSEHVLPKTLEMASELHLTYELHDIVIQDGCKEAFADIRYSSRARLDLPSGKKWDRHKDFNRIEFVKEDGVWKIVSGL